MSGVTTMRRSTRSSHAGIDTFEWLNIEVTLSTTSNRITATTGIPSARITAILMNERDQDFERMEAHPGGDVDIEIGVVHAVQPPEHRHLVEDDVLHVDGEIERQEADERGDRQPQAQGS